jgi:hypothetical protein
MYADRKDPGNSNIVRCREKVETFRHNFLKVCSAGDSAQWRCWPFMGVKTFHLESQTRRMDVGIDALSVLEKGKESVSFWQILFYFSDE